METKGNDPASPTEVAYVDGVLCGIQTGNSSGISIGLTKREQFAMAAMQAYAGADYVGNTGVPHEEIAKWAVNQADALINALNK